MCIQAIKSVGVKEYASELWASIMAIDGGKILFLLFELVARRKLDPKYESYASLVGLVLILGLFVFVTYNDILRLIRG